MRSAPSADRNKGPIAEVLGRHPPFAVATGNPAACLEIASGTGQHVSHFATTFPHVTFQPSEYGGGSASPESEAYGTLEPVFASISAYCVGLANVLPPVELDASATVWPPAIEKQGYDAIVVCNVLHISPFSVSEGLFAAAGRRLVAGGRLVIYGPFKVNGEHSAPSNEAFDARLRQQNTAWGVRDSGELQALAQSSGLELIERADMPANNFCLVFGKSEEAK